MRSLLILFIAALLTGCASTQPFTQQVRTKHTLSPDEIKQLQFYASHDIVLKKVEKKAKDKRIFDLEAQLQANIAKKRELLIFGTPSIVEDRPIY